MRQMFVMDIKFLISFDNIRNLHSQIGNYTLPENESDISDFFFSNPNEESDIHKPFPKINNRFVKDFLKDFL
jgi:hypothetical protein